MGLRVFVLICAFFTASNLGAAGPENNRDYNDDRGPGRRDPHLPRRDRILDQFFTIQDLLEANLRTLSDRQKKQISEQLRTIASIIKNQNTGIGGQIFFRGRPLKFFIGPDHALHVTNLADQVTQNLGGYITTPPHVIILNDELVVISTGSDGRSIFRWTQGGSWAYLNGALSRIDWVSAENGVLLIEGYADATPYSYRSDENVWRVKTALP